MSNFKEMFEKVSQTELQVEMWKEVKRKKKKPYKFYSDLEDSDIDEEFEMELSNGENVKILLDTKEKLFYFEWI